MTSIPTSLLLLCKDSPLAFYTVAVRLCLQGFGGWLSKCSG